MHLLDETIWLDSCKEKLPLGKQSSVSHFLHLFDRSKWLVCLFSFCYPENLIVCWAISHSSIFFLFQYMAVQIEFLYISISLQKVNIRLELPSRWSVYRRLELLNQKDGNWSKCSIWKQFIDKFTFGTITLCRFNCLGNKLSFEWRRCEKLFSTIWRACLLWSKLANEAMEKRFSFS